MLPVINEIIYAIDLINNQTRITIQFTKPVGDLGGYYLLLSSTGVTYWKINSRVDSVHRRDSSISTYDDELGNTYYEYTFTDPIYNGRTLFCEIIAISTSREESVPSSALIFDTYPTRPTNLFGTYDGYEVSLTWDGITFTGGENTNFLNYNIYRSIVSQITGSTLSNDVLSNSAFTLGSPIYVVDIFKQCHWFGIVTTAGQFDLSTTKILLSSDSSDLYTIALDRLGVYTKSATDILIGTATTEAYLDATFSFDKYYMYSVSSLASGSKESSASVYPIYTIDTINSFPYLRSPENSSTGLLHNTSWGVMKNALIDENYYDKTPFAIPYSETETYNLKGYLGVSNCKVDVYINDHYSFMTTTGQYGEFDLNHKFSKETANLRLQARDKYNIKFSRKSATYQIHTINIYTWYSTVLGNQYKKATAELDALKTDVSIYTCRYSTFIDRFSPYIGIYKYADEDETKFINLSSQIYLAFEYVAYDESLRMVLDAFEANANYFDHYEIYYNTALYQTEETGRFYVTRTPLLPRGDYYYGVSSATIDGEETLVSSVRADCRWWPLSYLGYNVLSWKESANAEVYRIYRNSVSGSTSTGLLMQTPYNVFVDNGTLIPNMSIDPLDMNFTDLNEPNNLSINHRLRVSRYSMRRKKETFLTILLFSQGSTSIQDYQITRIRQLCYKLIPPEVRYEIIVSNNISVTRYTGGPVA